MALVKYGYTVLRDRVVPYKDEYGDTVRNFQSPTTLSVSYSAHVQVTGSSERNDEGRKGIVMNAIFWFDATADINRDDRLRWNGYVWEIDGAPLKFDQLADAAHLQVNAFTTRG